MSGNVAQLLQGALAAARLTRSRFDRLHPQHDESRGAPKLPKTEEEVDEFIKNRIKLHHDSWIVGPLVEALRILGIPEKPEGS